MPIIVFEVYKYGTNTKLSQLKTGSRKYKRDTPLPASCRISIFFRKYINRQDKYRNTGRTELVFSVHFYPYTRRRRRPKGERISAQLQQLARDMCL